MDYTPTTEEVRKQWVGAEERNSSMNPMDWMSEGEIEQDKRAFDRWLAEVKAQAWEEGKTAGFEDAWGTRAVNPYRQGKNK